MVRAHGGQEHATAPRGMQPRWLILRYITGWFTADMCFGAVDRSDGHLALHGRPLRRRWCGRRAICASERSTAQTDISRYTVVRSDGDGVGRGRYVLRSGRPLRRTSRAAWSSARTDISRCTVVRSDGDGVVGGRYVLRSGRPLGRTSRAARSSAQTEMAWGAGDMCCGAVDRSDGHLALHGRPLRRRWRGAWVICAAERSTAQEHTSYTSRHYFWVRVSK